MHILSLRPKEHFQVRLLATFQGDCFVEEPQECVVAVVVVLVVLSIIDAFFAISAPPEAMQNGNHKDQ